MVQIFCEDMLKYLQKANEKNPLVDAYNKARKVLVSLKKIRTLM